MTRKQMKVNKAAEYAYDFNCIIPIILHFIKQID